MNNISAYNCYLEFHISSIVEIYYAVWTKVLNDLCFISIDLFLVKIHIRVLAIANPTKP